MVSDLENVRDSQQGKIHEQAAELVFKNGQLVTGIAKQAKSDERIHVLIEAMESMDEGIYIVDARRQDFPVIYANRSFQSMIGRAKTDIIGRSFFILMGTVIAPHTVVDIQNTLHAGKAFHKEIPGFQKNGNKHWNLLRITPVRDARGIITHYIGIQADISVVREQEIKIDEQRDELLHVTRVGKLAEFVSSLAHEISQPLTSILFYAQAAQRMLADKNPEVQKILGYIVQDNQRATEVIRRLRSLLKKSKPDIKPLDINALINETLLLMATDMNVRNIVLTRELASDLPVVNGDRIQLQQVMLNLISNSFDAMEHNRDSRELRIRTARQAPHAVRVEVTDTGSGISAKNMPKLFTHFFTSKPDGLGMGLSISRSIVEAHGGRIAMANNPDRGATFYFTLPPAGKDA
jgi:PAS domain S-box-containing protein